jgi:hypothetical protein
MLSHARYIDLSNLSFFSIFCLSLSSLHALCVITIILSNTTITLSDTYNHSYNHNHNRIHIYVHEQDHTRTPSSFTMLWTEEWATHSPMTLLPTCPTTQVYTLSPSLLCLLPYFLTFSLLFVFLLLHFPLLLHFLFFFSVSLASSPSSVYVFILTFHCFSYIAVLHKIRVTSWRWTRSSLAHLRSRGSHTLMQVALLSSPVLFRCLL